MVSLLSERVAASVHHGDLMLGDSSVLDCGEPSGHAIQGMRRNAH